MIGIVGTAAQAEVARAAGADTVARDLSAPAAFGAADARWVAPDAAPPNSTVEARDDRWSPRPT